MFILQQHVSALVNHSIPAQQEAVNDAYRVVSCGSEFNMIRLEFKNKGFFGGGGLRVEKWARPGSENRSHRL
jgi:hypothetical protein